MNPTGSKNNIRKLLIKTMYHFDDVEQKGISYSEILGGENCLSSQEVKSDLALQLAQLKEEHEQMKYGFRRKIESYEAQEKYYGDEVEYWKRKLDSTKSEIKSQAKKYEDDIIRLKNDHLEEISDFSEKISQLELRNDELRKQLLDIQNKTVEEHIKFEKVQELEDEISNLKEKLSDFNKQVKILENNCHELKEQNLVSSIGF